MSRACLSIVEDLDASYRSGVRTVGRSVGLMLEALSLGARTQGKDRRRKLSPRLCFSRSLPPPSLSLSAPPLSPVQPTISFALARSRSLLLSPYLSTTRHCVLPRRNPVYSLTLWIFRKRFAAAFRSRRASVKLSAISRKLNFSSTKITSKVSPTKLLR